MNGGRSRLFKSVLLTLLLLVSNTICSVLSNVTVTYAASNDIIIHYCDDIENPYIYYWNSLPTNIEVEWPGKRMTEKDENGYYVFTIQGKSKINFVFTDGKKQTEDLTVNKAGEYWYKNGKLTTSIEPPETTEDFRDETIYFVITSRFYDGYYENNVHCVDDTVAKNPDSDPAWRGDFQGLIDKLDYIKALGFSAIWITPVVENGSSYDYHGYHAINFNKVDPRYESPGATYQDLINACHEKGIKVIQDIVLNHTSNNGEENLFPIMTKDNKLDSGVENNYSNSVKNDLLGVLPSNYDSLNPTAQYQARDAAMKKDGLVYRNKVDINYEGFTVTTGQFAGDCMELNTENPTVYNDLVDAYNSYIDMGVDAFRIDTTKHISRLTFNEVFLPAFSERAKANGNDNFYMFGEVAARIHEFWNHGNPNVTPCFYTWKEAKDYSWNNNSKDGLDNLESTSQLYDDNVQVSSQRTSDNAFLNGNEYHEPDYSEYSGLSVIDYPMHFNFESASNAMNKAREGDAYYNDATWNVTYVDSHDYGPSINGDDGNRYGCGTDAWAENLNLLFTFRGIPCLYYGSEVEFQKGVKIDAGNTKPLSETGRAYFGDYIEGSVVVEDFAEWTNATGTMKDTLNHPLAKHIQRLNKIRREIPALSRGQYSFEGITGNSLAYKRRYTGEYKGSQVDSFVCVSITDGATFTGIPNGTYVDAITGTKKIVSNGTLSIEASGKGNMRVYVLQNSSTSTGKIGDDGTYLK